MVLSVVKELPGKFRHCMAFVGRLVCYLVAGIFLMLGNDQQSYCAMVSTQDSHPGIRVQILVGLAFFSIGTVSELL